MKIKLIITNCKSEINSLLDRIRGKEISHIIVTTNGNKLKCYGSVELPSEEGSITIAKCLVGLKIKLLVIKSDNVAYCIEQYNDETWNTLINIDDDNYVDENTDDRLYG